MFSPWRIITSSIYKVTECVQTSASTKLAQSLNRLEKNNEAILVDSTQPKYNLAHAWDWLYEHFHMCVCVYVYTHTYIDINFKFLIEFIGVTLFNKIV